MEDLSPVDGKLMNNTNLHSNTDSGWNIAFWFPILSPLIGILLGFMIPFLIYR